MYYKVPKGSRNKFQTAAVDAHKRAAIACLQAINTTYPLDLMSYLERGELSSIQKPNPDDYCLPNAYLTDAQAYAIIGKNKLFCNEEHLVTELVSSFLEQENYNRTVNQKFSLLRFDPLLDQVRSNVFKIIGEGPSAQRLYGENHLANSIRFGPGSSYFASGNSVNPMDKIRNGRVTYNGNTFESSL